MTVRSANQFNQAAHAAPVITFGIFIIILW
jgi:hypothetical protein